MDSKKTDLGGKTQEWEPWLLVTGTAAWNAC